MPPYCAGGEETVAHTVARFVRRGNALPCTHPIKANWSCIERARRELTCTLLWAEWDKLLRESSPRYATFRSVEELEPTPGNKGSPDVALVLCQLLTVLWHHGWDVFSASDATLFIPDDIIEPLRQKGVKVDEAVQLHKLQCIMRDRFKGPDGAKLCRVQHGNLTHFARRSDNVVDTLCAMGIRGYTENYHFEQEYYNPTTRAFRTCTKSVQIFGEKTWADAVKIMWRDTFTVKCGNVNLNPATRLLLVLVVPKMASWSVNDLAKVRAAHPVLRSMVSRLPVTISGENVWDGLKATGGTSGAAHRIGQTFHGLRSQYPNAALIDTRLPLGFKEYHSYGLRDHTRILHAALDFGGASSVILDFPDATERVTPRKHELLNLPEPAHKVKHLEIYGAPISKLFSPECSDVFMAQFPNLKSVSVQTGEPIPAEHGFIQTLGRRCPKLRAFWHPNNKLPLASLLYEFPHLEKLHVGVIATKVRELLDSNMAPHTSLRVLQIFDRKFNDRDMLAYFNEHANLLPALDFVGQEIKYKI